MIKDISWTLLLFIIGSGIAYFIMDKDASPLYYKIYIPLAIIAIVMFTYFFWQDIRGKTWKSQTKKK